jgi:hypothetical protein
MPVVTTLAGSTVTVDLETRDFEGYRSAILDSGGLADTFTPDWADRSELDLGVAMTEGFSFMGDIISYYQDRCANEALFPAAVKRKSVIDHCKLLGYELSAAVSAEALLTFVTSGAGTVPEGTQIKVDTSDGSDPATFELAADFVATGSGTTTGVSAYEGVSTTEILGSSDGSVDQSYSLSNSPLALNPNGSSSLVVQVTAGGSPVTWTEVDNFLASAATDEHFRTVIDENDEVTVIFGDGVNGKIPASGTNNISATYRVGGGHEGNQIAINKLTKLVGSYSFVSSVTNPAAPSGGIDRESIEIAKKAAPLSLKALDRAVNHDDYKVLALKVPGVLHATAYRGNGPLEERIVIAASGTNPVPAGSWNPYTETGSGLIGAVGDYVNARKTTPVILQVHPIRLVEVLLTMQVYLLKKTKRDLALRIIEDDVLALFKTDNQTLGQQMPMSGVSEVVEIISGVDYVDLIRMQRVPVPYGSDYNSATDISFGSFIVGPTTVVDNYTIEMLSATTFEVHGEATGAQGSGTVGSQFTASDGYFSFTATAGVTPATAIDKFYFQTGEYLGNIDPQFIELVKLQGNSFQLTVTGGKS